MVGHPELPDDSAAEKFTRGDLVLVWQTLEGRRAGYDAMMWQTPSLGMTAQAFLLTLALGSGSSPWARLVAALLSLILSLMVVQLMAKHRRHELLDSLLLEHLENSMGLSSVTGVRSYGDLAARHRENQGVVDGRLRRSTPGPRRFWAMSSYDLWMVGLGLFGLASLVIIGLVAFGVSDDVLG